MTNGQIVQLQELGRCWMVLEKDRMDLSWLTMWEWEANERLTPNDKALLRRLTHQYRHQIAAMRKNREAVEG